MDLYFVMHDVGTQENRFTLTHLWFYLESPSQGSSTFIIQLFIQLVNSVWEGNEMKGYKWADIYIGLELNVLCNLWFLFFFFFIVRSLLMEGYLSVELFCCWNKQTKNLVRTCYKILASAQAFGKFEKHKTNIKRTLDPEKQYGYL